MIITSLEYSLFVIIATTLGFGLIIALRTIMFTNKLRVPKERSIDNLDVDSAVQRLSKAIQFKTISNQNQKDFDGEEFLKMHKWLKDAFPLVHQNLQREVVNGYSLLYTWKGDYNSLKPVMFTSHLDVVPIEPGTENDWLHPPFSGTITDEYVYGRGAMDVQCGVMAILEAVEWQLTNGYKPARTIYFGFGHDEEVDGLEGAKKIGALLAERGVELEFLLDEGLPIVHGLLEQLKNDVALIAISEKGYLSLELTAETEGGHSSVPQGATSIAVLSKAIHKLEKNQLPSKLSGIVQNTFETMAPRLPVMYRSAIANLWLFKKLFQKKLATIPATNAAMRTTTATTIFDSGIKENVLPTSAKAIVNFRIHPNDTVDSVVKHVRKTINDSRIKIKKLEGYIEPSPVSDVNNKYYKLLRISIRQVFKDVSVSPSLMIAATDARHYTHLTENVYRFLPLRSDESDLDRVHGTNERIAISNYADMIRFFIQMMRNTAVIKPGVDEEFPEEIAIV